MATLGTNEDAWAHANRNSLHVVRKRLPDCDKSPAPL